jgi:cytochrome c
MTIRRLALLALAPAALGAQPAPPARPAVPVATGGPETNRFTRRVLVEGMDEPMALDFDRAGRVYWVERRGALRRFDERTGQVALLGTLAVFSGGEAGLGGILLARDFETSRQLYLYYSAAETGDAHEYRLARFTLGADDRLDPRSEVVLLRWPHDVASHFGGGMVWDARGNLYLSTGDNSDATQYATIRYTNPGGKGQDSRRSAGNTNDLRGKILRITPQPDGRYTIPAGNLFAPGTPNARPEIYTMGNRNPWRLSIDSRTGYLHWGEIGPDAGKDSSTLGPMGYDEFNVARSAGNFGWPFVIGYQRAYPHVDNATGVWGAPYDPERLVNDSPNNTGLRELPPARPPLVAYPYGVSDEFPPFGSGGRMADGGPVYHRADFRADAARPFPAHYEGKWLVVDFVRNWIMALGLDGASERVTSVERLVPDERFSSPIDVKFGPEGDLYLLEYGTQWGVRNADARISRIEYNAGNRAPRAVATASRTAGATPLRVTLSARGTVDHDGDALRHAWVVTRQGAPGGAPQRLEGAEATITLAQPGTYVATLTATDPAGARGTARVQITAGNEPPTVTLALTRGNRSFYFPGGSVAYRATASDREDGARAARGVRVTADYVPSGMTPAELAAARDLGPEASLRHARALSIIGRSDCRTCHLVDAPSAGPSFRRVAQRYRGDSTALDRLAQKIIAGGGGVWGEANMPAHPAITPAEAATLAQYVMSLGDSAAAPRALPASGTFATAARTLPAGNGRTVVERGAYVLRATYTDGGANGVAPIAASDAILLRHPRLAPETAELTSGTAFTQSRDPGFFVNRNGAYVGFRAIDLTGVGAVAITALTRFYTWSHFKGATATVHLDRPDAPAVGAPVSIVPDPAAGMVFDAPPKVVTLPNVRGVHDVYVVFRNPSAGPDDALVLLTAIEFRPAESPRTGALPDGFTPLFDGRTLKGWHPSRTTHHGTTPDVRVEDGAIVLRQHPYGQGGVLLTDRKFRDFELTLEARPDWGTNGGIFFRSTEGGSAYQIEMVGGGAEGTGSLFGEMLRVTTPTRVEHAKLAAVWKADDWNAFRIRVEGAVPRVALWVNGVQLYDVQLARNDLVADRTEGSIGLQAHWSATARPAAGSFDMSGSWKPGAAHRYRNVAIRDLSAGSGIEVRK